MKLIFKILLLSLLPLFAAAQPLGTWPVSYGDTPPTHTPSGSGTRIYLNITTNDLWNWNPSPVSAWIKYPKGFDQISGCAAPGYTPTARQSVFAVNSCTVLQNGRGPELYQYTGSQWVCLNCYPAYTAGTGIGISSGVISNTAPDQTVTISGVGITPSGTYPNFTLTAADQSATNELNTSVYVDAGSLKIDDAGGTISVPLSQFRSGVYNAGTGISINSGTGAISNTGDLSTTNELNTSLSVSGGNVRLTDPGGTLTLPVTDVAPLQSLVAGAGINITGSGSAKTITNSAPNVTQILSISGSDLTLSGGGGTVTLPGGGASDALGTGFVDGGGSGTIPGGTVAGISGDGVQFLGQAPFFIFTDNGGGSGANVEIIQEGIINMSVYDDRGSSLTMALSPSDGSFTALESNLLFKAGDNQSSISFNMNDLAALSFDAAANTVRFSDMRGTPIGIEYADYYPEIETNDNSLTSTRNVNALKQTPVSYTNAAAPNNTIFYSTTLSKLAYKDPGGTVNALY